MATKLLLNENEYDWLSVSLFGPSPKGVQLKSAILSWRRPFHQLRPGAELKVMVTSAGSISIMWHTNKRTRYEHYGSVKNLRDIYEVRWDRTWREEDDGSATW
jgi:hypothetical protein